ncbi:MAG: hypothetical protein ACLSAF_09250 [Intestinimonas sp.]
MVVCAQASLEQVILGAAEPAPVPAAAPAVPEAPARRRCAQSKGTDASTSGYSPKSDLIEANMAGVTLVSASARNVSSPPLPKDAAKDRGMSIVSDEA